MGKRIKPVSRIDKIEQEINQIVGEFFYQKRELLGLDEGWNPNLDVCENKNEITVEIELPGVVQKDITLLLHSNRLEIKGIKKENLPDQIKYIRLEREYGPFRRFVFLPQAVVPEKATASMKNGVLTITLKKLKREKPKEHMVKIQKEKE